MRKEKSMSRHPYSCALEPNISQLKTRWPSVGLYDILRDQVKWHKWGHYKTLGGQLIGQGGGETGRKQGQKGSWFGKVLETLLQPIF